VNAHPAPGDGDAPPERSEEELISDADAAIEELSDPTSRMADDLGSVLRNAERIRTGAILSGAALATVSRSADSLTPLASALSSLSNRINLLALNLAVLVNPGARDSGEFDKAGDELRGLFEETRRLSREVGSLSQRAAGAARSARETSEDLVAAATDGHARAERGLQELAHLEELTMHLRENLEETRRASRRASDGRTRLAQELSTAEAAEAALAGRLRELHRDAERWVADLREIATTFHDTRTSGEGTVRALLEACEQRVASGRSDPAAETRSLELLRHAALLLEALTAVGAAEQTAQHF
jgi:methyl-accepting chemotaxis protein